MNKPFPEHGTAMKLRAKFALYRLAVIPPNASPAQLRDMEMAFLVGAEAMFDSMIDIPDEDTEGKTMCELKNEIWQRVMELCGVTLK